MTNEGNWGRNENFENQLYTNAAECRGSSSLQARILLKQQAEVLGMVSLPKRVAER